MTSKRIPATATSNIPGAPISIGGRTRIAAVFGDPVEHSMSPAMHNAAYAALFMDRVYLAFHVTPEHLRAALHAMLTLGFLGANLTVPHKEAAARIIKNLSAEAKLLRAVNCVVNDRGKLRGDNTDARGLEADLRGLGIDLRARLAIVIGAGGAAASAILALSRLGAARIVIANRTRSRAANLVRRFHSRRTFVPTHRPDGARPRRSDRRRSSGRRRASAQCDLDGPHDRGLRAARLCRDFRAVLLLRCNLSRRGDALSPRGDRTGPPERGRRRDADKSG